MGASSGVSGATAVLIAIAGSGGVIALLGPARGFSAIRGRLAAGFTSPASARNPVPSAIDAPVLVDAARAFRGGASPTGHGRLASQGGVMPARVALIATARVGTLAVPVGRPAACSNDGGFSARVHGRRLRVGRNAVRISPAPASGRRSS